MLTSSTIFRMKSVFLVAFVAFSVTTETTAYDSDSSYGYKDDHKYPFIPYKFGYDIVDEHGNKNWRKEEGQSANHIMGSYGFQDNHGIMRHVDYVADGHGFRAKIRTNEPGTAPNSPAGVKLDADPVKIDHHDKKDDHYGKKVDHYEKKTDHYDKLDHYDKGHNYGAEKPSHKSVSHSIIHHQQHHHQLHHDQANDNNNNHDNNNHNDQNSEQHISHKPHSGSNQYQGEENESN